MQHIHKSALTQLPRDNEMLSLQAGGFYQAGTSHKKNPESAPSTVADAFCLATSC